MSKQERLRRRGSVAFVELLRAHGGTYSAAEVARRLGLAPDAAHQLDQRLLSVNAGEHRRYPVWQFTEGGLVPGLEAVMERLKDAGEAAQVRFFLTPAPELGGRTPLDALSDPPTRPQVLRLAEQYGEQGAH